MFATVLPQSFPHFGPFGGKGLGWMDKKDFFFFLVLILFSFLFLFFILFLFFFLLVVCLRFASRLLTSRPARPHFHLNRIMPRDLCQV